MIKYKQRQKQTKAREIYYKTEHNRKQSILKKYKQLATTHNKID